LLRLGSRRQQTGIYHDTYKKNERDARHHGYCYAYASTLNSS
jgi:hypothetical protein